MKVGLSSLAGFLLKFIETVISMLNKNHPDGQVRCKAGKTNDENNKKGFIMYYDPCKYYHY